MPSRPLRFRPSLREQLRRSARSSLFQANPQRRQELLADPNVHESVKEGIRRQIAFEQEMSQPARQPAKKRQPNLPRLDAPHKPLEREIQKAIIEALRLHPRVLKVVRFNSGGSLWRDKRGNDHLVLFSSEPVPDLFILLRDGFAWLEVKRPPWSRPTDAREERQAAFLEAVRHAGGIGAFVRSVDEAMEAIK